jgi:hypothetical protein
MQIFEDQSLLCKMHFESGKFAHFLPQFKKAFFTRIHPYWYAQKACVVMLVGLKIFHRISDP